MIEKNNNIDLSIENAWILTMDEGYSEFRNGCIQISGGKILYIGSMENKPLVPSTEVVDAKGMIISPPFFNGHAHAPMSLFRGLGDDSPLKIWLEDYIWPAEAKYLNADFVYLGSLLSGIETIHSGTNIFADMYFFEDEVAKASSSLGLRSIIGEAILDYPTPNMKDSDSGFAYSEKLIEKYTDNELVSLSIPAHAPYTCSEENLRKVANFSKKYKIPASIHLSETKNEVEQSIAKLGKSPVKHLADIGFFDYHAVCHHCVHLSTDDIAILKEYEVSVVTLPNSNCKLASGIAPVKEMLDAGINVALGTDGAASNNNSSMLNDLQLMTKLQKVIKSDPTVLTAKQALQIATLNGAKAYRMDTSLGSLEIGKKADMIFIDTSSANMTPIYDPYAQIVYSMQNYDIHSMLINGEFILKNRTMPRIDKNDILNQARKFAEKLNIN